MKYKQSESIYSLFFFHFQVNSIYFSCIQLKNIIKYNIKSYTSCLTDTASANRFHLLPLPVVPYNLMFLLLSNLHVNVCYYNIICNKPLPLISFYKLQICQFKTLISVMLFVEYTKSNNDLLSI